jgi:hypothetical protein
MKKKVCAAAILILPVLLAGILSGCATVTSGTSQAVTVNTKPTGAICTLSRGGNDIAVVNPTPGSVTIDKSSKDVSVNCKKDGYNDGSAIFSSSLQAMTFGNILLGGVIGVAIDAGSGAMHKYPAMLSLTLLPKEFASSTDRDKFFDGLKEECINECANKIVDFKKQADCGDSIKVSACQDMIKIEEKKRDDRLAELENLRMSAKLAQQTSLNSN